MPGVYIELLRLCKEFKSFPWITSTHSERAHIELVYPQLPPCVAQKQISDNTS
jgi:hypothetical protein